MSSVRSVRESKEKNKSLEDVIHERESENKRAKLEGTSSFQRNLECP